MPRLALPRPFPKRYQGGMGEAESGKVGRPVRPAHVLRSPDHLQPCGSTCRIARVGPVGFPPTSRGSTFRGHELTNGAESGEGNCDAFGPHPSQRLPNDSSSNPGLFISQPFLHLHTLLPIFDGGMHETGWRVQGQGLRPSLPFSLWRRLPFGPGGAADRPMTQYITQPSPALGSRVLGPFEL